MSNIIKEEEIDEGFYVSRKALLTVLDRFEGLFREYHTKTLVFHFCGDAVYVHKKDDAFELFSHLLSFFDFQLLPYLHGVALQAVPFLEVVDATAVFP